MGEADVVGAGGQQALVHAVMAEVALEGDVSHLVESNCVVRARLQA